MKKIFKYDLHYYSVPEIVRLPAGAKVIDFQIQNRAFKLWCLVDSDVDDIDTRVFILAMTGQPLEWEIVTTFGTRVIAETGMVVHLLELSPDTEAKDAADDDRISAVN